MINIKAQGSTAEVTKGVDFFVSYAGVDEDVAERIARWLEDGGYKVIFAKWDFRPGNNFPIEMQKACMVARRMVCVFSAAYFEARYPTPEWASFFAKDPNGTDRLIIPVLVEDCEVPGMFKALVHIDLCPHLRVEDFEGARVRLLIGVSEGRAKPDEFPSANSSSGTELA